MQIQALVKTSAPVVRVRVRVRARRRRGLESRSGQSAPTPAPLTEVTYEVMPVSVSSRLVFCSKTSNVKEHTGSWPQRG